MKIQFKNFRCHKSGSFDIMDKGLTLLSGESGAGKSTVLCGIVYALYGGIIKKPYTFGFTTCKVELSLNISGDSDNILYITRTKPKRVIVTYKDKEYEDEAGQNLINSVLGMTCEQFMASSYMVQNQSNSVLSMSPTEQLKFIEGVSYDGDLHIIYKTKLKDALIHHTNNKTQIQKELEILERYIDDYESKLSKMNVDDLDMEVYTTSSITDTKKDYEAYKNVLIELQGEMTQTNKKLQQYKDTNKNNVHHQNKLNELTLTRESEIRKKQDLGITNLNDITQDLHKYRQTEKELNDYIQCKIKYDLYKQELQKYEEMQEHYFDSVTEQFNDMNYYDEDDVKKLHDMIHELEKQEKDYITQELKYNEYTEKIQELKPEYDETLEQAILVCGSQNIDKIMKCLKSKIIEMQIALPKFQKQLDEYKYKLTLQHLSQNELVCPSCNASVILHNSELILSTDEIDSNTDYESLVTETTDTITEYTDNIPIFQEYVTTIQKYHDLCKNKPTRNQPIDKDKLNVLRLEFSNVQNNNEKMNELENIIDNRILNNQLTKLLEKCEFMKNEIGEFQETNDTISDLYDKLSMIKHNITEIQDRVKKYHELNKHIQSIDKQIHGITKILSADDFTEKVNSLEIKMQDLNDKYAQTTELIQESRDLLDVLEMCDKYNSCKNELNNLQKKSKDLNQKMYMIDEKIQAIMRLSELSRIAEVLSVKQTIDSLNMNAKVYLDNMFDEPIQIRLENSKDLKGDTKSQMNTIVEYKGNSFEGIDSLSGGEQQRANLAYLLALNDIMGSKILLLDECLNNLDHDMNSNVLMFLKEVGHNKTIICVSHEACDMFDQTICV